MTRGYPLPGSLDVLFVTYGGGHVQMVLPVARRLKADGLSVSIFALTTAIGPVAESGLPFFTYADLPSLDAATQTCGKRLAASLPSTGLLPPHETYAYLGVNFRDLERSYGPICAAEMWSRGGRQTFHPVNTMRDLMADLQPKLVVATNSPRSEKAAVEAASALDIAAVAMVDMFALQEMKWLSRPDFGRHLFVLDESVRQRMIGLGRPAAEVTVTGNPAFDALHDPDVIAASQRMRTDRGWGGADRIVILYASTPEPERHPFTGEPANPALPRQIEEELRRIVTANSKLELVIRRHPSEDQSISIGNRISASARADDVNMVIHAVDLVVVTCSTVGLQAYLAGRPLISVGGSVFSKDAPYGEYGMATPVPEVSVLREVLSDLLNTLSQRGSASATSPRQSATNLVSNAIKAGLSYGWET